MLLQLLLLHVSLLLQQPSKNFTKQQTSHDFLVYPCATIRSASAELLALVFKPGVRHINILLYASAATRWLSCVIRNVTAFSARGMYENSCVLPPLDEGFHGTETPAKVFYCGWLLLAVASFLFDDGSSWLLPPVARF